MIESSFARTRAFCSSLRLVALVASIICASLARADTVPDDRAKKDGDELPWQSGPRKVDLGHDVEFDLPAGYAFLGPPHAGKVMESMGNLYNDNLLGIVIADQEQAQWFVTLRYDAEGYVKDDEKIDADELLGSMRDGLEEFNEERKTKGFPPLALDGWDEKPHYDRSAHHLVWCLRVSDKDGASANFNTRVLGRKGYVSINLVTDPNDVQTDKHHASAVLAATRFKSGARYEDFDGSKDKVAEYGLAGLVLGGAGLGAMKLVKLGLLAKFWKVLLAAVIAGKKAIIALFLAGAAGLRKFFGRKGTSAQGSNQA
jgi:uncharacterized membrane-anchored protein